MFTLRKKLVLSLAIVSSFAAATLKAQTPEPAPDTNTQTVAAVSPAAPRLEERYPRYKIQNQDTLLLSFPLSPELNQTVTVQPDGYINLQSAGSLHIQGMTVPELVSSLKTAYAGILHNPIINVDLEDYQKPFFTVTGQVGKPGQYDMRRETTVSEAIAVAGGLIPTAKTQVFLFHHTPPDDVFEVRKMNLKEVLDGKHPEEDAVLKPGDMVFVPEKFIANFRKYVPYTLNAGSYVPIP
jgi:polysaccharide biosynthesis/export protein